MRAVCVVFLCATGCTHGAGKATSTNWLERSGLFAGAAVGNGDKAVFQTVLIDQPAGDPYLTHELWEASNKPLPPDRAALLAENGLRVAIIDGNPPPAFLKLVTSEVATVRPNQGTGSLNESRPVAVNGPVPRAVFATSSEIGGERTTFDLTQAECAFSVTPTAAEDGRIRLTFEPRTQHGTRQSWLRPSGDGTGFAWLDAKPGDAFPKLSFDVTLGPKEYLVLGPTASPVGKLGGTFFLDASEGRSHMRVLVIRAWRGVEPETARKPTAAVAAQASQVLARGQSR